MTPKQKKHHIDALVNIIENNGFIEDRWGNYKKTITGDIYRIKVMKNNLRIERLIDSGRGASYWFKVVSNTIVKIDTIAFEKYITTRFK